MYRFFLCLAIAYLSGVSCKKDDGLTEATQSGAHTFSCKIDGSVFTPCNGGLFSGQPLWGNVTITGGLVSATISARCTRNFPHKEIFISLDPFTGVGSYLMNNGDNVAIYYEDSPDRTFSSAFTGTGKVTITKDDRQNGILSGLFEFDGREQTGSDIVIVTGGRFDIKY